MCSNLTIFEIVKNCFAQCRKAYSKNWCTPGVPYLAQIKNLTKKRCCNIQVQHYV